MNEEILAGLKGAIERGFQLDEAVQSFINAGYSPAEVNESASLISRGFAALPSLPKESSISKEEPLKKGFPSKIKWIIIILAVLVVLGVAISLLLFKNQFLGAVIDPIFP